MRSSQLTEGIAYCNPSSKVVGALMIDAIATGNLIVHFIPSCGGNFNEKPTPESNQKCDCPKGAALARSLPVIEKARSPLAVRQRNRAISNKNRSDCLLKPNERGSWCINDRCDCLWHQKRADAETDRMDQNAVQGQPTNLISSDGSQQATQANHMLIQRKLGLEFETGWETFRPRLSHLNKLLPQKYQRVNLHKYDDVIKSTMIDGSGKSMWNISTTDTVQNTRLM